MTITMIYLGMALLILPALLYLTILVTRAWPLLLRPRRGERHRLAKTRPGVHMILAELESQQLDRMRARARGAYGLRAASYATLKTGALRR